MKIYRKVSRRHKDLRYYHDELPINPHMEHALLYKLQDIHFQLYLETYYVFLEQLLPYYRHPVKFIEDPVLKKAIPVIADEQNIWFSEIFQLLVISGSDLTAEIIIDAKKEVVEIIETTNLWLPTYDQTESLFLINKQFDHVMYQQGWVDEINLKLMFPKFRHRMKNGLNLAYCPSFPLHAFANSLTDKAKIHTPLAQRSLNAFIIFYWNFMQSGLIASGSTLVDQYLKKAIPLFNQRERVEHAEDIFSFVQESILELIDM